MNKENVAEFIAGDKVTLLLTDRTGISKSYEGVIYENCGLGDYLVEVSPDGHPFTVLAGGENMNELENAVSNELEAKALSASTTTTHPWDESHTAKELVASLTVATYENSSDARLLLRNPNGLLEEWRADPADVKAYSDLRNGDGDFTFEPLEERVAILKGRIAEGYVPIGISAPGSKYVPARRHAVGFGLAKEVAGLILRAYGQGFERAQDLHGESLEVAIDTVRELFGNAVCAAFLNAYKSKN
jgi:hypothetical protein